jgi:hypothetical protein
LNADLCDGCSAQPMRVTLRLDQSQLHLGAQASVALAQVRWPPRGLAHSPLRTAVLPDGRLIQSTDVAAWDAWCAANRLGRKASAWASSPWLAYGALAAAMLLVFVVLQVLWPLAAQRLTPALPQSLLDSRSETLFKRFSPQSNAEFWGNRAALEVLPNDKLELIRAATTHFLSSGHAHPGAG